MRKEDSNIYLTSFVLEIFKLSFSISKSCEKFCYDLPPVRDHRKAGIGYGTKYDFTK